MKKISIIIALLALSALLNAQFYFRSETGYMFSSHPLKIKSTEVIDNKLSVNTMSFKYGAGVPLVFSFGYDMNSLFGIELSAGAHIFSSYKVSTDKPDLTALDNFSISGFFGDIKYQSNIFQIAPQMVCHFTKDKFTLNLKAGPNFLKSRIIHKMNYTDWELDNWEFFPLQTYEEVEYKTDLSVGLRSSIGIDYLFSSDLSVSMNLVSIFNRCKIISGEIKRYDIDGVNHLSDLTTITEPDGEEEKVNFSQVGITIGVKYSFGKKN
jgi:hypothetical protein